jgi:hypothetical protein
MAPQPSNHGDRSLIEVRDVWTAAQLLIPHYGPHAAARAAERTDELRQAGDVIGRHPAALDGHAQGNFGTSKRAYAWSSPVEGSTKRRFFAVLHVPPINWPVDAVRTTVVAEHGTERKA